MVWSDICGFLDGVIEDSRLVGCDIVWSDICGFLDGVIEDSRLVGCDIVSQGEWFSLL